MERLAHEVFVCARCALSSIFSFSPNVRPSLQVCLAFCPSEEVIRLQNYCRDHPCVPGRTESLAILRWRDVRSVVPYIMQKKNSTLIGHCRSNNSIARHFCKKKNKLGSAYVQLESFSRCNVLESFKEAATLRSH